MNTDLSNITCAVRSGKKCLRHNLYTHDIVRNIFKITQNIMKKKEEIYLDDTFTSKDFL